MLTEAELEGRRRRLIREDALRRRKGEELSVRVFEVLPIGVEIVRDYADGRSLLECSHDAEEQRPTGQWAIWRPGFEMRGMNGHLSERSVRATMSEGETLDYSGELMCQVCKGLESTTETFRLKVQMVGVVPKAARPSPFVAPQGGLF